MAARRQHGRIRRTAATALGIRHSNDVARTLPAQYATALAMVGRSGVRRLPALECPPARHPHLDFRHAKVSSSIPVSGTRAPGIQRKAQLCWAFLCPLSCSRFPSWLRWQLRCHFPVAKPLHSVRTNFLCSLKRRRTCPLSRLFRFERRGTCDSVSQRTVRLAHSLYFWYRTW
jgi:hypothetical protein